MSARNGDWSRLPAAAVFDQNLKLGPLRVLAALACYVSRDGLCWPSVGTLANRLGTSDRNVQKHIRELEAAGYVTVDRQSKGYKGRVVNTYQLHYPKMPEPIRVNDDFTLPEHQRVNLDDIPFLAGGVNSMSGTGEATVHPSGELAVHQGVKRDDTQTAHYPPNDPPSEDAHFPPRNSAPVGDDVPMGDDYGFEGHDDEAA